MTYNSCDGDNGWMAITKSNLDCNWEQGELPVLLYAATTKVLASRKYYMRAVEMINAINNFLCLSVECIHFIIYTTEMEYALRITANTICLCLNTTGCET